MPLIKEWESFYVIVGSSAAALTGLQFVVITLAADLQGIGGPSELDTFSTPTVVHFGAVLLLAGILTAPWHIQTAFALVLGVVGAAGVMYSVLVTRRAFRPMKYQPVLEDWMFHVVLPAVAYVAVTAAALNVRAHAETALFIVGTSVMLLLFVGIHNAWDTVTYLVIMRRERDLKKAAQRKEL